jgi:CheY-like chemotaxis protein
MPRIKPAKILLVDDRPENLLALEAVLEGAEYELILAHSGPEAIDLVKQHADLALLLLDVQMPGMDGYEVATLIKAMPERRDIPIIFISAVYTDDPFVVKGYRAGAVDYFGKPFDPEILRLKVGIYTAFRQKAELLREKERQIKESEELYQAGRKLSGILETLPVGVAIADVDGRVCQTNEELLRICKSVEPARTDSYGEFLGWWDHEGRPLKDADSPLQRVLRTGRESHNEIITLTCFDGTRKSIVCSASPLHGRDGHLMGAVLVIQDVTAHKKIEVDLEKRILSLVSLGVEFQETVAPR